MNLLGGGSRQPALLRAATARARKPVTLWQLAGHVYHEAIFQGSVSAAGSSAGRLLERMGRDSRYVNRQARMVQIFGSFYLLFVAFLPAVSMQELAAGTTHEWNMFVAAIAGTIHLVVQTGYLMILTLIATSEILAPGLYRWPASLPLRSDQAGMLRVMALGREFLLPLTVIALSYPIVAGLAGGFPAAAVALGVSLSHAALTLSVTVLASWRLRRTLRSASGNDRRATTVRVVTMAGYGLGIVLIIGIMQFGTGFIASLIDEPRLTAARSLAALRIMSVMPLPSSGATLVSAFVARGASRASALPLWMPLLGTVLYGAGSLALLRLAWRHIGRRESDGEPVARVRVTERATSLAVPLRVRTARAAFRRQIFQTATRDTGILLALLFPLIIPTATLAGPLMSGAPSATIFSIQPVVAALLGGWMLIHGLSRMQVGTGRLEASLPLLERDRAFPRLFLCAVIPAAGSVIAGLVLMPPAQKAEALLMATIPAIAAPVGFLVKTALFGRIGGAAPRIVVEEVFLDHRFWKWAAVIGAVVAVAGGLVALRSWLSAALPGPAGNLVYLAAALAIGACVRLGAGLAFPASPRASREAQLRA